MTMDIKVKWDGINYSDVIDIYDGLSLVEGGKSHNPDRPTMQTATGSLVLRIVPTDTNTKYDCKIRINNAFYWKGTIKFVNQNHKKPKRSTWRFQGVYTDVVEENVAISENASTIANILNGLSPTILNDVEQDQLDARNTLPINFNGSKGELISRLSNIASAVPIELPDTVKFVSINAIQPNNVTVIDSRNAKVRRLVNNIPQTDHIRNKARIALPDIPGTAELRTQETIVSVISPILPDGSTQQSTGAYTGGTFNGTFPLPEGIIENLEAEAIDGIEYINISIGDPAPTAPWQIPAQPVTWREYMQTVESVVLPVFPIVTVAQNGTDAIATVEVPDLTIYRQQNQFTYWGGVRTLTIIGSSAISFSDATDRNHQNLTDYSVAMASQYGLRVTVRISYILTTPDIPQPPQIVTNNASIQRWGIRELKINNWLSSNNDLSTFIETIASLRSIYIVDIPAEEITVNNGDYALIRLATEPRIDSFVLIIGRHLTATPNVKSFIRLTCLELAKIPPP